MNVLSLFDGMSCGQIALNRAGIKYDKYYASEIDKQAIKVTQHNYPNTIQLGSVTEWRTWDIDWSDVGLICAGSPCQGFSFAGKQLAFDDPRSVLFFVFIDILNNCKKFNPYVKFLLENVDMKRENMAIINAYCGVFPININSNLVSGQNRNRWYWSNIKTKQVGLFGETHTDIKQPEDKDILIYDILENNPDSKYYLSDNAIRYMDRKVKTNGKTHWEIHPPAPTSNDKSNCVVAIYASGIPYNVIIEPYTDEPRRLTPIECERLQTVPDNYTSTVADCHRYKMLGNGWTIDVIAHIFSFLK